MDYNNVDLPFDYVSITQNDIYRATEFLAFCMHYSIANLLKINFNNGLNPYYVFLYDINLYLIKDKDRIVLNPAYHKQEEGFYKVTYLDVNSLNAFDAIKELLDKKEMIFVETAANKIKHSKKYRYDENKMDVRHVFPFIHYNKDYLFLIDQKHMLNYQYFKSYRESKIFGVIREYELLDAFEHYLKLGSIKFDKEKIEESYLSVHRFLRFCISNFYRKDRSINDSTILYGERCLIYLKEGFNRFSENFTDISDELLYDQYSTITYRYYMCRKYLSECLRQYNKTYNKKDITSLIDIIDEDAKFWQEILTVCTKSYLTRDKQINNKLGNYFARALEKEKYLYYQLEKYVM